MAILLRVISREQIYTASVYLNSGGCQALCLSITQSKQECHPTTRVAKELERTSEEFDSFVFSTRITRTLSNQRDKTRESIIYTPYKLKKDTRNPVKKYL